MSNTTTGAHGEISYHDRVYLEKLKLATDVLLRHAEDPGMMTDELETELHLLRDQFERALLLPETAGGILPWREGGPAPEARDAAAEETGGDGSPSVA